MGSSEIPKDLHQCLHDVGAMQALRLFMKNNHFSGDVHRFSDQEILRLARSRYGSPSIGGPAPTPARHKAAGTDKAKAVTDPAQRIIDACEAAFEANKGDCNKFVKAVAAKFNIQITGNANAITDAIQGAGWTRLADGSAAAAKAARGHLVIGGLKGADQANPSGHGHVVVVVKGARQQGKYPKAYWGRLGGSGSKNKGVNWAWRKADRDNVKYGAKTIG